MFAKQSNFYAFTALFLVLIIDTMGFGLILPILPPLFLSSHANILPVGISSHGRDFYYGLTMAIFFIFVFIGAPFVGDLSDQLGRKKVILLCLLGVAVGYFISALAILYKSLAILIAGRAISGFASGSQTIAQAAIIDRSGKENKTFNIALITLASCIGFIIGPLIGGYFSSLMPPGLPGFALPFFVAALLALINALGLFFTFKETHQLAHKHKISVVKALTTFKTVFALKQLRLISLIYVLIQFSWGVYFQFISLYLAQLFHYPPYKIGHFMAYLGVVFSLSLTVIVRSLLSFMHLFSVTILCLLLALAGLILMSISKSEVALWLSTLPVSIGIAILYAVFSTLFSNRVSQDSQGMIMGVVGSLGSLAWVIAGLSLSLLTAGGIRFPFIITSIIMAIAIFLTMLDAKQYKY